MARQGPSFQDGDGRGALYDNAVSQPLSGGTTLRAWVAGSDGRPFSSNRWEDDEIAGIKSDRYCP